VPGPGPTPNCCGQAKCAGEHRCYGHPHAHYHKKPHHHKQPAISGLWRTLEWVLGKVFSKLRKAKVQYQGLQTFPPESKCGGRCRVHLTPKCGKKCRTSLALAKNATSLVDVTPQPTPACDGMCQPTGTCHKHCQERKQSAGNCPPWRTNMTEIAEEGARLGNAGARESAKFATAEGATWGQNWASMTATRVERGGTPCNETDFTVVPFGNPVHCADGVRNIINAGKPNATIITKSTSNAPLSAKELEEYDRYLEHEKQWMEIIRKRSWLIPDIPWRRSVDGNGTAARNGTAPPSEEEKKAFETIVVTYILAVLKPDGTNLNSTIDTILQFAKDHPQEFGKRENRGPFVHVKAANGTEKVVAIHGQRERMIESVVQVEEVRKTVVKTAEPAVRTVSDVVTVTSTRVTEAVRTAAV
jgi:hypothetical protein